MINDRFGGKTKVLMNSTIDLEKPAYSSTPNIILSLANLFQFIISF